MAKRAQKIEMEVATVENDSTMALLEQATIMQDQIEGIPTVQPEVDASGRKKKINLSMEELEQKGLKNKSQVIRFLDSEGYSRSAIALFLNVRYQHVRNVLVTPLKKG